MWDCVERGSCYIDLASGIVDLTDCELEDYSIIIPSILKDIVKVIAKCNSSSCYHITNFMELPIMKHYFFVLPGVWQRHSRKDKFAYPGGKYV